MSPAAALPLPHDGHGASADVPSRRHCHGERGPLLLVGMSGLTAALERIAPPTGKHTPTSPRPLGSKSRKPYARPGAGVDGPRWCPRHRQLAFALLRPVQENHRCSKSHRFTDPPVFDDTSPLTLGAYASMTGGNRGMISPPSV